MLSGLKTFVGAMLFAVLATASPAMATLVTFDFEEFESGWHARCPTDPLDMSCGVLVSNGLVFDPGAADWSPDAQGFWLGMYGIADPTQTDAWRANNGTKYLAVSYYFDRSTLNIYSTSGSVFGVKEFDLAESVWMGTGGYPVCTYGDSSWLNQLNCSVTFIGYLADGGTISQTVILDGINDGAGPLADFETFTFDGRWNRLTMFTMFAAGHAYLNPGLDNLVLRTAPEPSALALLGLGLAGLAVSRRRKQ